jgi:hypothetical protein
MSTQTILTCIITKFELVVDKCELSRLSQLAETLLLYKKHRLALTFIATNHKINK